MDGRRPSSSMIEHAAYLIIFVFHELQNLCPCHPRSLPHCTTCRKKTLSHMFIHSFRSTGCTWMLGIHSPIVSHYRTCLE